MAEAKDKAAAQELAAPDTAVIETGTLALRTEADALVVESAEQYEAARPLAIKVKNLVREIEGCFGPLKAAAYKSWKAIGDTEDRYLAPVKAIEGVVKDKMKAWAVKEQAERAEAQRKVDAEARRVAEEKREADAKAARDAAKAAKEEGDKAAAKTLQAKAREIEKAPIQVVHQRVESKRPVLEGVAMRQQKSGEVTDAPTLLRHLADHPDLIPDAIEFKKGWILDAARKGEPVPGVTFSVKTIAALGCAQRESDTQAGGHLPDME